MKRTRSTTLTATIALSLALLCAACVSTADQSDTSSVAIDQTTSTRRTIPEEAPTTAAGQATTTTAVELGAPEDPNWLGQDLSLLTLATLDSPTALTTRSGGDDLWITERAGRIRQIQRRISIDGREQSLRLMNTVVLDISDKVTTAGEGGLLGLTFSTNGRYLYVNYTNNSGNTVISEFEMGAITAFPGTERVLLEIEQPFSNHNGGQVTFGPDGFLYVGMGDGGSGGDPLNSGQDTSTLLGAMLRIDPAAATEDSPYGIPGDNPFADGSGGQPEIWSWGLRNPWRFSWDAETGDLWIADVGQNQIEEITVLRKGSGQAGRAANLGWRIMEGDLLFEGDEPPADHVAPAFTYDHSNGRCSITGGYVYRGDLNAALEGVYLFGDYCSGEIFGLDVLADGRIVVANLIFDRELSNIVSFGEGSEGELYVLEANGNVSLIRRPGVGPRTQIVDSDDQLLGGEVDDSVTPNPDPNAEG
ncbi:MAG: PQQ-dependent sugar dehydrogenase [Acidimicrobiales bacterium]